LFFEFLSALINDHEDSLGYSALLIGAFFEAVDRRFSKNSTTAGVVNYVADVRARFDEIAEAVDPLVTERLIRATLGEGSTHDIPGRASVTAKLFLVAALIADEGLDSTGLDEFIAKARKNADYLLN
jgi:hypothetical protein